MRFFHRRIHESIALSAVLSVSFALHVAWIANALVYRSEVIATVFTLLPSIGPVSGLYTLTVLTWIFLFLVLMMVSRGRDVSHWRERTFWFFLLSVLLFSLMTFPVVYQIGVVVEI